MGWAPYMSGTHTAKQIYISGTVLYRGTRHEAGSRHEFGRNGNFRACRNGMSLIHRQGMSAVTMIKAVNGESGIQSSSMTRKQPRRKTPAAEPASSEPQMAIGVREEKKNERLMRIKQAARALFFKKGYDRTTLRDIATRAGIPAVTILRYVEDKRDLLYLLFNEDHARVTELAVQEISETRNFLDESIAGFRHYYRYFSARPEFARCILREVTFIMRRPGNHAYGASSRNLSRIKRTVEIARVRGEIRHSAPDEEIARLIFELYQIETRRWLIATKPDVETGLKSLRASLAIIMEGLAGGPAKSARPAANRGRSPAAGKVRPTK